MNSYKMCSRKRDGGIKMSGNFFVRKNLSLRSAHGTSLSWLDGFNEAKVKEFPNN